jgi:hypothetical protein
LPAFTASILQLWHVMQISFEIGAAKAHNGFEDLCGFGCTDHGPGWDWRLNWGF